MKNLKFIFLHIFTVCIFLQGCAGKNIHPNLKPDTQVLVRLWTLQTHTVFEAGDRGTEFSNPIKDDHALVFGSQSMGLVSMYPGLVQTRWVLPISKGVISELTHDRDSIYFGGGDGFLYSVQSENGRVNWRYDLHNPIISQPTVSGGRVFVTTSDDTVYAFDAGTGKWLWHYKRRSSPSSTILGASAPLVDETEVITGLSDGFLVSLSIHDGQLKWERKLHLGNKFTDVDARPILDHGIIYVSSYDGALYALKRGKGEIIWRFDSGASKPVYIDDQVIYLPSSDGTVYALQKSNAKILWKFELDSGTPTRLASSDRYLMFGSSYRYFYVLDKKTGQAVYRYDVGYDSGFYGSPLYDSATRKLYTLSSGGNLFAFALRQSSKRIRPHGMIDPYDFE